MTILSFEAFPAEFDTGEDPEGTFSRLAWLPIVGPSSWLIWGSISCQLRSDRAVWSNGRRLVAWDFAGLARAHGLKQAEGETAPLRKTLHRLVRFGLFRPPLIDTGDCYEVRRFAPPLTDAQLDRSAPHVAALQRQTFGAGVQA